MKTRLQLHNELISILGNNNVYYQPPTKLNYPCILYQLDEPIDINADNINYAKWLSFTVTYISKTPEDETFIKLLKNDDYRYDRQYIADNLNHFVFKRVLQFIE